MNNYMEYLVVACCFALVTGGWMAVQLLARKTGTKNHMDNAGNCCGSCEKKEVCPKTETQKNIIQ